MSINIEGISSEKGDIVGEYCKRVKCDILCVQENHWSEIPNRPSVRGMKLAVEIPHGKHGSAIFTNPRLEVVSTAVRNENDMEILTVELLNCTVTSVYKPPKSPFSFVKPVNFDSHPVCIVIGDFNRHSMAWGYRETNEDGCRVEDWATDQNLMFIHD